MYQIIGVQRNQTRVVVATTSNAGAALTHYRALQNQKLFPGIVILSPESNEIDGFELSRRYEAEERARYV